MSFVTAFGWVSLVFIGYLLLLLNGALWSYAIRQRDETMIPLIVVPVLGFAFALVFLVKGGA